MSAASDTNGSPDLIPLHTWAARRGLPLSTAYVVLKRHAIPVRKIGRSSFVASDDDARFMRAVMTGEAATASPQNRHLRRGKPKSETPDTHP